MENKNLGIGDAIRLMIGGHKVRRAGGESIAFANGQFTRPLTTSELLATDWESAVDENLADLTQKHAPVVVPDVLGPGVDVVPEPVVEHETHRRPRHRGGE